MREKVRDRGRLEHILEAIESIEEFHAQYTFEDIKKNKLGGQKPQKEGCNRPLC